MPDTSYINFPLVENPPPHSIQLIPFGTTTLKLRITNPKNVAGKYILRPVNIPEKFGKETFFGHEDNGKDLIVSWGGGHKFGNCVLAKDATYKLARKDIEFPIEVCSDVSDMVSSITFFNITHVSGETTNHNITLGGFLLDQQSMLPEFSLKLECSFPEILDPVRLDRSGYLRVFTGQSIPDYVNRWWPSSSIQYSNKIKTLPLVSLQIAEERLTIKINNKLIIEYSDAILFSEILKNYTFDVDLFSFTENHLVIRVWFFWLKLDGLSTLGHELPDIERYDFIVDIVNEKVVYAATDTHWREIWVEGPEHEKIIKSKIGLLSPEVFSSLPANSQKTNKTYINWLLHSDFKIAHKNNINIPSEKIKQLLDPNNFIAAPMGRGFEAHVPYFINCPPPPDLSFVSSDPRTG